MTSAAVAFKAKQPALIADYLAAREVAVADFHTKADAFKESIGGHELFGTAFFDGGWAVRGFNSPNSFMELPAGWRREGGLKAVPARRTPEGKEHAKTLATLRLAGNTYPGCPNMLFAEGYSVYPRVEQVGDDYFLTLSMVLRDEPNNSLDPEAWEQVKLSEYHAALEAAEEAAA
ncbi:hypothetical protein [Pseudarthrobacter sp. BIM B-2242]|uniref:hypothetical protein n=1 Tax=Pseudarthrobacter sp. BIM B-2242 TaxID=2772401 RepID=UPI00168BFEB2|nr:hypothetical protein [Pseudarthrobacter sp. BIM B-2242]QOD06028.1 hypothetical protein IDT60_20910 [Pseudarthrobacter sp. BIM B-2242]